ncbi:putative mitochondrial protein [Cucumis melo var. makuwa]|uniref:Mitochondrial protein n=1 Tax=Cucumis melo var. makuwa TaxID=1194695 RepID=A0A5A7VCL5_CUCMM|nr:putative mitochondrial protein [Cucumis melo var. makuwa]
MKKSMLLNPRVLSILNILNMCISLIKLYMGLSKLLELEQLINSVAQIYVDDIIFGGLQIKQKSEGIFISQEKYAKSIIKKFGLEQSRHKRTPAATHVKITKDTEGARANHKLYRSIIGSLLYLTASRPNIAYTVGKCARYQADPRTSHLEAVKRILKYVHETSDFGIMYSYDTTSTLVGYCDADWVGSSDDRKSTFGGCFFLENNLISWFSKKQNCVSLSTAEAEYIAAGTAWRGFKKATCTDFRFLSSRCFRYICTKYLDNVPVARLLKKTNVPEVTNEIPADPSTSVDSQESSSTEGVFILTLGTAPASNV